MARSIAGIHHVTAISSDPQRTLDFYTEALGLRLVKCTINFDDPTSYHLYFGDETGAPGTVLTFFSWPDVPRGKYGTGQVMAASFSIPQGSVGFWRNRLMARGLSLSGPSRRFEDEVLGVLDPDGLRLELSAHPGSDPSHSRQEGPIPPGYAIRGFRGVTLAEHAPGQTANLLVGLLAFRFAGEKGNRTRYVTGAGGVGGIVDILSFPDLPHGRVAVGSVHHVALRAASLEELVAWRSLLLAQGLEVTSIVDRVYFRSVYFREPGGVLFEISTDAPGFAVDEPVDRLGSTLTLPPWMETMRARIAEELPRLRLPEPKEPERRRAS